MFTHFPKDRNCEVCRGTKITRAPCSKRSGISIPRAEKFGDLITADHKVRSEKHEFRKQSQVRGDRARFCHSMVAGVSVQNKNFTGNRKEFFQTFLIRQPVQK